MTCAELDQRAVDYLYGELGPADRKVVEAHLATCEACRRELRALERTLGVTREALRGPLAQEAPSRVRLALQQEAARVAAEAAARQSPEGGGFWAWLRRPWFLPAVASFAVVTLFFLAKPAIVDKPRETLQQATEEIRSRAEEPEAVPAAPAPAPPPVPATAPAPPEPEAGLESSRPRRLSEKKAETPARPPAPVGATRGAGAGPAAEERARRDGAPSRRSAAAPRPAASRWAEPPPAAAPPPAPAAARPPPAAPAPRAPADDGIRERAAGGAASGSIGRLADTAAEADGKGAAPAKAKSRASANEGSAARQAPGGLARAPAAPATAAAPPSSRAPAAPPAPAPGEAELAAAEAPASRSEEAETSGAGAREARELPLAELRRRADLAFQQSRWDRAIRDYRELLRRFGDHADAPLWRRRLEISTQSAGR